MTVLTDPSGWFTLEVPEGWGCRSEDCVTVLTSPRGFGILYLSAARHVRGRQSSFGGADFLTRFLQSLGVPVDASGIHASAGAGCRIYTYRHQTPAGHWSFWSITDDETAMLICHATETPPGEEGHEVDSIVQSVRLYHSAFH